MQKVKIYLFKGALLAVVIASLNACLSTIQAQDNGDGLPNNIQLTQDFAYGPDLKQRMDIYAPSDANRSPIILMLHGGGYYGGDKANKIVFINKLNRWGPKGFIIISINTRKLPEADGYEQAKDLAMAIVATQKNAAEWGGDPNKLFIMGHSSGGHLVSLLCAKPSLVTDIGGQRWLAGFSLDSSSMNIPQTMSTEHHAAFFDAAFGKDPAQWISGSPIDQLSKESIPLFAACSVRRGSKRCEKTEIYADTAKRFGVRVVVSPQNIDHGGMNVHLGLRNAYTRAAEKFMASLDKDVERRLDMN